MKRPYDLASPQIYNCLVCMYNPYYMGYVTNRQARRLDLRGVNVKKRQIINRPDEVVSEALEGMELCFPALIEYAPRYGLVRRRTPARDKVGIISGGGSGHEPLHAGFVGTARR
jgi:hypothetical protein